MTDLLLNNKEYDFYKCNWRLVRDLVKGESALKEHDLQGLNSYTQRIQNSTNFRLNERYLPMPDAANCGAENLFRYSQYVQRASLFNATKRSLQGMSGMVFGAKSPETELPNALEYLLSDADGSEAGLEQQAQEVLNDILMTGREGLLVDFPETNEEVTVEQAEELAVRANIVVYKAESIVDWDSVKVNAASKLSFVKLVESISVRDPDNIFQMNHQKQFRVLILNQDGNYEQRIYSESSSEFESRIPLDANGQPFDYIPFFFIGSVNNRPNIDPAPLTEIAEVNLAHYRNSADFEESCFIVGQPMLTIAGLSQAWADEYFKDGISFGSRSAVLLPEGGSASIVQAAQNSMPENGMTRKQKQMIELGARLITEGSAAETAEAARIKHSADASVLTVIVRNINQAYTDAIAAVQQFMTGAEEEFTFAVNTNFFESKMTAQDLTALVAAWQSGAFTKDILDRKLQEGGVISDDIDLDEMNEVIAETPIAINFDEEESEV